MNQQEATAAMWTAIAKIAAKEGRRDDLLDGAGYQLKLSLSASFGRARAPRPSAKIEAALSIGHPSVKASSSGPAAELVLALVLAELPAKRREQLLAKLPRSFARRGELPAIDKARAAEARQLLERLRVHEEKTVRGPVACRHTVISSK